MSRRLSHAERLAAGRRAARRRINTEDRAWSTHSSDKPDIGLHLMGVLRDLHRRLPASTALRVLSVGSSSEPQLPILQAACRGGVTLLDVDAAALAQARAAVAEHQLARGAPGERGHGPLRTVVADMAAALADRRAAAALRHAQLNGERQHLVTFHHSLYYVPRAGWDAVVAATYHELLAPVSALHAVLMSASATGPSTTTALYDRWAGACFGARNDQDLAAFGRRLRRRRALPGADVRVATSTVYFDHDHFETFMGVVWMILLHPQVHRFSPRQQDAVTEWVYRHLWSRHEPLVQRQDHLVVARGGP